MTNDPVEHDRRQPNRIQRILANPIVSAAAWIATIISVPLAIFLYLRGTKERELFWYVNPSKAVVVNSQTASSLHVFHMNRELTSDVTAAQVSIWNAGNESIRTENVLEKIQIATVPSTPILEVRVRRTSRNLLTFTLDQSRIDQGIVGVAWNILEKNDGAQIQLVYAGPPTTQLSVSGTIEGQHSLKNGNSSINDRLDKMEWLNSNQLNRIVIFITPIFSIIAVVFSLRLSASLSSLSGHVPRRVSAISSVMFVICLLSIIYSAYWMKNAPVEPPVFGVSRDVTPPPGGLSGTTQ